MTAPIQPSPLAKPLAAPVLRVAAANPSQMVAKALPTDVKGADLQGLQRFQQSLTDVIVPTKRVVKKKVDGEEESSQEQVVVSDSEDYEVAQADTSSAGAAAVTDAGGAAAGGSGAGTGAGAGAGTAVNLFSPLMFAPLLGLALDDGNTEPPAPLPGPEIVLPPEPTPGPAPAPRPAPRAANIAPEVVVEHSDVKLPLNAGEGDILCAVVSGTDADNGPSALRYFFWNNGTPSTTSADGYFSIDESGQISLTALGEAEIGAGNPVLPCGPSIELSVVAFDGANYSTPKTISFDRVLPDWSPEWLTVEDSAQPVDTMYAMGLMGGKDIDINDEGGGLDLLDVDAQELRGALHSLEMARHGDSLKIEIEGEGDAEYNVTVYGQYQPDSDPDVSVEYIHFQKEGEGTTYGRYDLGGVDESDVTSDCPELDPYPYFQDHGVYLLSTAAATDDGQTLQGTVCNDVIVGSGKYAELLDGGKGKDLLFAQVGDTVSGGAGNDLIVIDDNDHDHDHDHDDDCDVEGVTIQFGSAATNGVDTVVGADEHTFIDLQSDPKSFTDQVLLIAADDAIGILELDAELEEPKAPEDSDFIDGVIALSSDSDFKLYDLVTSESDLTISIGDSNAGKTLHFLSEEVADDGVFTHLYEATDGDNSGTLSTSEFTLLASFYNTSIDTFNAQSFSVVPA